MRHCSCCTPSAIPADGEQLNLMICQNLGDGRVAVYAFYAAAHADGWPTGTGAIERACRHLVKGRMDSATLAVTFVAMLR